MDRISLKFLSEFHFVVAFIHLPLSLPLSLSLSLSLCVCLSVSASLRSSLASWVPKRPFFHGICHMSPIKKSHRREAGRVAGRGGGWQGVESSHTINSMITSWTSATVKARIMLFRVINPRDGKRWMPIGRSSGSIQSPLRCVSLVSLLIFQTRC